MFSIPVEAMTESNGDSTFLLKFWLRTIPKFMASASHQPSEPTPRISRLDSRLMHSFGRSWCIAFVRCVEPISRPNHVVSLSFCKPSNMHAPTSPTTNIPFSAFAPPEVGSDVLPRVCITCVHHTIVEKSTHAAKILERRYNILYKTIVANQNSVLSYYKYNYIL
jgi:hypothetical protein